MTCWLQRLKPRRDEGDTPGLKFRPPKETLYVGSFGSALHGTPAQDRPEASTLKSLPGKTIMKSARLAGWPGRKPGPYRGKGNSCVGSAPLKSCPDTKRGAEDRQGSLLQGRVAARKADSSHAFGMTGRRQGERVRLSFERLVTMWKIPTGTAGRQQRKMPAKVGGRYSCLYIRLCPGRRSAKFKLREIKAIGWFR